jgi:L-lactate dehydrogenase complex protein LldG
MEKEAMLNRIRASLETAVLPAASYEPPARPPSLEGSVGVPADPESLREAFITEAQSLSAQVYSPDDQAEAIGILLRIVQANGAEAALAWDEEHLPVPGVWETLITHGVQILDATLPAAGDEATRAVRLAEFDRATVGITGAQAGLADTGSLALPSGPGRGRLASLLPPVHIAVLPVASLCPDMTTFLAAHPDTVRQASNLVLITGPSRTADIEQVLTLGVHGPRELHILLIPQEDHD